MLLLMVHSMCACACAFVGTAKFPGPVTIIQLITWLFCNRVKRREQTLLPCLSPAKQANYGNARPTTASSSDDHLGVCGPVLETVRRLSSWDLSYAVGSFPGSYRRRLYLPL